MQNFDVTAIGNAIVDVLSFADEPSLARFGLPKGSMTLIDETRAAELYSQMGQATECSGGSAANTLAGLASLGAKTSFTGKVKNDQLGAIFTHDLRSAGVQFTTPQAESGPATAGCLVYVTPDAQRTMATYIGACSQVRESDIDEAAIQASAVLYIEGYLWDTEAAKSAIRKAISVARIAGRKVAFTLSDTFCVDRHREEFLRLIGAEVDILFANEAEIVSLFEARNTADALDRLRGFCPLATVTRGAEGSAVVTKSGIESIPTQAVANIVDTTGAGDLYAAGFLFALTRGQSHAECAALGNRCAGRIITQLGARSMTPLSDCA